MDTDAGKAKRMQLDLIRYLRRSLSQSRRQSSTLGQEIALLRAYLDIYKIRMGAHLHDTIHIPDALDNCPIAPMLLQPLVENALLHGLAPKLGWRPWRPYATTYHRSPRPAAASPAAG